MRASETHCSSHFATQRKKHQQIREKSDKKISNIRRIRISFHNQNSHQFAVYQIILVGFEKYGSGKDVSINANFLSGSKLFAAYILHYAIFNFATQNEKYCSFCVFSICISNFSRYNQRH
jgi:hypothetical protein